MGSEARIKTVHVRYFAVLRERRGLPGESVVTDAPNWGDLYRELDAIHRFGLDGSIVRVAVGDAFVESSAAVADGTTVVFIPPVAGG
ncbi:MAG: MoaD/ThiS family protein [Fimbriimonadaceae bacterium]|nr:MoaD/ThiS family protein [Fimbriimonadaceae bacterium]